MECAECGASIDEQNFSWSSAGKVCASCAKKVDRSESVTTHERQRHAQRRNGIIAGALAALPLCGAVWAFTSTPEVTHSHTESGYLVRSRSGVEVSREYKTTEQLDADEARGKRNMIGFASLFVALSLGFYGTILLLRSRGILHS